MMYLPVSQNQTQPEQLTVVEGKSMTEGREVPGRGVSAEELLFVS
jgi:hypothetical protein